MRIINYALMGTLLLSAQMSSHRVWAVEQMSGMPGRENVEKIEKDIAKDKDKVSSKKAEITTAQAKLTKDVTQFGDDSSDVRDDHKTITSLRNDLVDLKADLYKDVNKKKVALDMPVETESSC